MNLNQYLSLFSRHKTIAHIYIVIVIDALMQRNNRRQREVSLATLFFPPIPNDHYFKLERATSFPAQRQLQLVFRRVYSLSESLRLRVCVCVRA